ACAGDIVNGDDVGVVKRTGGAGLLGETPQVFFIAELLGGQQFQGDEAIQPRVTGFVDHAHAALPELFGDFVVRDGTADHREFWVSLSDRPGRNYVYLFEGGCVGLFQEHSDKPVG